ncbi:ANTAR domain-containing protein [Haloactinospora alba]|uniref:ANTAR domain-containing protein n=1 Tax=Haloactinospora alba TaxID=405555 RepID=A0A543NF60_9ACTN|nr:ANTAR domain-containing protein [Haloactinospora alba]
MGKELGENVTPHSTISGRDTSAIGIIERTPTGWRVGGDEELPDLMNAMVLADLLAAEEQPQRTTATKAPGRAEEELEETERLRLTVAQLEHALHSRVVVEQAIGTLAERHQLPPREAFDLLRSAARSRGRKVADVARDVVTSSTNPLTPLPAELAGNGAAVEAET